MEYVLSCAWVLMELVTCLTFLRAFLEERSKCVTRVIIVLSAWGACSMLVVLKLPGYFTQVGTITVMMAVSLLLYRGSLVKHILLVALYFVFNGIIDTAISYGVCAAFDISFLEFRERKFLFTTVATIAKLVELCMAYILRRLRCKEEGLRVRWKWLLLTILFPVLSLVILILIFVMLQDQKEMASSAFVFSAVLAVANVGVLYLIRIMEKRTKDEHQLILMKQQAEIQTNSINELEKSYRAQRKSSHEFLHHMQVISDLLDKNHYTDIRTYIDDLQRTHTCRVFAINTHHSTLDVLFNQKYQCANEKGIAMEFEVNDLSCVSIPISELVVLFSNLFDNAIEACEKVSCEPVIYCKILANDSLYISIRNSSLPVTVINKRIKTTKEKSIEHGFGLPNICRILDDLSAEYDFGYADGYFYFVADIPL